MPYFVAQIQCNKSYSSDTRVYCICRAHVAINSSDKRVTRFASSGITLLPLSHHPSPSSFRPTRKSATVWFSIPYFTISASALQSIPYHGLQYFVLFIEISFSLIIHVRLSDVGMIMMQTGMVKQGLNSACHTYIDGTIPNIQGKCILYMQTYYYFPPIIPQLFVLETTRNTITLPHCH